MVIFNKKESVDWQEKYNELLCRYDNLYDENRELKKRVKDLELRIKKNRLLRTKRKTNN